MHNNEPNKGVVRVVFRPFIKNCPAILSHLTQNNGQNRSSNWKKIVSNIFISWIVSHYYLINHAVFPTLLIDHTSEFLLIFTCTFSIENIFKIFGKWYSKETSQADFWRLINNIKRWNKCNWNNMQLQVFLMKWCQIVNINVVNIWHFWK